ncbi:DUF1674 domain-containing protein [Luteibacter sp. NPDC031894]|uniref:DUF1674 domain-containing protein n=1 Tax=Luteibacter sp. NPDC031894 TaxID=3390572 RepID=UPI003D017A6B
MGEAGGVGAGEGDRASGSARHAGDGRGRGGVRYTVRPGPTQGPTHSSRLCCRGTGITLSGLYNHVRQSLRTQGHERFRSGEAARSAGRPHDGEAGVEKAPLDPTRYGDWEKNGRCIDF